MRVAYKCANCGKEVIDDEVSEVGAYLVEGIDGRHFLNCSKECGEQKKQELLDDYQMLFDRIKKEDVIYCAV